MPRRGETPETLAAARARTGPAGFLADLNPAMTDVAGAIADMAIPEKATIQRAFCNRVAGPIPIAYRRYQQPEPAR
jgi:hypothetical protein